MCFPWKNGIKKMSTILWTLVYKLWIYIPNIVAIHLQYWGQILNDVFRVYDCREIRFSSDHQDKNIIEFLA